MIILGCCLSCTSKLLRNSEHGVYIPVTKKSDSRVLKKVLGFGSTEIMDTLNLNSDSSFWFSNCSHIHYGTWQLKDSIYFSSDSVYHKSKKSFVDPQSIANIPPAKYDSNRLYMKVDGKDVSNNPISIIAIFRKTN